MSSMLRQHHVKIQDLVNYLRGYDPAKPQTAEDWSKQESSGFEPGMLIFCLERVSAPSGLAFGKKDSEGETYRVKDLCVVVGRDNNRSLVVNITASAFELRYLEVLMLEKARKAILDGKDFLYVAVKPAQPLGDSKLREIEELGAMYAQGGSRRSLVVDASGPQEPAVSLLAALGVKLTIGGIGKQALDIGLVCHLLFAPEGRQEDKNKVIVKSCFAAIPNNEPIGKGGQTSAFTPQQAPATPPQRIRPAPVPAQPPQDWGAPSNSGWAQDIQSPPDTAATAPQFAFEQAVEAPPIPPAFGYDQQPQPAAAPGFGYEQGTDGSTPVAPGFGYEQGQAGSAPPATPGFGYDQATPGGEPTPWNQTPAGASGGFGLSGLNPFAPPEDSTEEAGQAPQFEQPDLVPPDFTSQFKDDLAKGLAGESAIRYEENQMAQSPDKWAIDSPAEFSQDEYSQKFAPPPDLPFGSPAQQYGDDQFPPSTVFNEQQFNNEHFQAPDFGKPVDLGPVNADLNSPPQEAFSSFPPIPPPNLTAEDMFQPPYAGAVTGEFQLPQELTAQLDPQNQLFQAPATEEPAVSPPAAEVVPEVNFGFDAFNQQPPSEFVDSVFDTTSGAFEKTSRAMSFDEEIEEQAAAKPVIPEPTKSSTNLPAQTWAMPTDDWAQATPPTSDWGIDAKPVDEQPWTPEPGASGWAPEPTPTVEQPPAWNFDGASQAPAWTPEQAEPETTSSASWAPVPKSPEPVAPIVPAAETAAPDEEDEPSDGTPSLFERLNQQLEKGSLSEIEPPPVAPLIPGAESDKQAETAAAEKVGEPALNLAAELSKETSAETLTEPEATASSDAIPSSEYASTPLPPPIEKAAPLPVPDPLPIGVSKKNAPQILDWPSASDPSQETADNLPSIAASSPAATEVTAGTSATNKPATDIAASATGAGDGIKHLAEALSGLMGDEDPRSLSPFANMKSPVIEPPPPPEPPVQEVVEAPAAEVVVETPTADAVAAGQSAQPAPLSETIVDQPAALEQPALEQAAVVEQPAAVVEPPVEEEPEEEEELSPSALLAAKGFQEPRLVMNEMASLMSKLEQQVQKAAKRLNGRAEEIKQRLLAQVDSLVTDCTQIEKESQRTTTNLSQRLIKSLDDACEESRLKVSDVAANGRYSIKQLLTSNQTNVDETKNTLYESLREACKQFRIETEALARTAENDLNELVNTRTEELDKIVQGMNTHMDDTNGAFIEKLNTRFERFKERMSEEASSVIRSLERNVRSMVEEIDGSWDRASDKLKTSKSDFEQTILHSVKTAELNLSQSTRLILTNALIPKLRERQQVLRMTSVELSKRFSDESERQVSGQILGLEASLGAARQQLQTLVDDCMSSIDSVGRGQQAGLEDIFKETSAHAERATIEVTEFLNKIETQINENEQTCKRLAEQSSLDSDPELSTDRNQATQSVQQLRQHANAELTNAIDQGCAKLEQLSNTIQTDVTGMRVEQTQAVRDAAENGLTRVRDAIQEAFSAIQAAREKYME